MHSELHEVYEFGGYRLDAARRTLTRSTGEPVVLKPRVFDVLRYLVEHPGELVEKRALLAAVWPGVVVEEHNLNKCVSVLRRALGDAPEAQEYIATIPGRGYQFVRPVVRAAQAASIPEPSAASVTLLAQASVDGAAKKWGLIRFTSWRAAGGVAVIAAALTTTWLWTAGPNEATRSQSEMSVAVLPFISIDSHEAQYLGDGVTEELIVRLGRIPNLTVSPLTASLHFKGKNELPGTIANTLGVRYLIEGSLRLSGDRVRLGVRLIDTHDPADPWQRTFAGARADLPALQDQISLAVVERLQLALLADIRARLTQRRTNSAEAQEVYFRARAIGRGAELDDLYTAIRYYEEATRLDPQYVAAYVSWADTLLRASQFAELSPESPLPVVRGLLDQALALDPEAAGAHAILAFMAHLTLDCAEAADALAASERIDPDDIEMLIHFSRHFIVCAWDPTRALDYANRAAGRDPWAALHVTLAYWHQFDYANALHEVDRLTARFPDYWVAYWSRWWILDDLERYDEALEVAQQVVRLNDYNETQTCLAIAYARVGAFDEARRIYNELAAREEYWAPSFEALLLVALGEDERALDKLEEAHRTGRFFLAAILHVKALRPLHDEPRFWQIVDALHHRQQVEALEAREPA
jgi:adenylate cyclase